MKVLAQSQKVEYMMDGTLRGKSEVILWSQATRYMFEFLSKRIERPKPQRGFLEKIRDFGAGAIQTVRDEVHNSALLSGIFGDSRSRLIREQKIPQVAKSARSRPSVTENQLPIKRLPREAEAKPRPGNNLASGHNRSLPSADSRTRAVPPKRPRTQVNIDESPLRLTKSQFRLDQHLIPVRHGGTSMSDRYRYTPTSRQIQKVESFRDRISQMGIEGDEGEIAVTKEGEFLSHSIVERFLSARRTKLNCRVADSITHMSLDFLVELDRKLSDFFRSCDIATFAQNFPGGLVCCNSQQAARSPAFFSFDIHTTAADNLAACQKIRRAQSASAQARMKETRNQGRLNEGQAYKISDRQYAKAGDDYEVEITDVDEGADDGIAEEFLPFDDEIIRILPRDEALQLLIKKFPREISFEMDPDLVDLPEDQLYYLFMFLKKYPPSFFSALGYVKIRLTATAPTVAAESQLNSDTFFWDVNDIGPANERQLLKSACACESPTQFTWARERRNDDTSVLDRRLSISLDSGLSMNDEAVLERFLQLTGEFSFLPDWVREIVFTDDPALLATQKIPRMSQIPDAVDVDNVTFLPGAQQNQRVIIDMNASSAQIRQQFLDIVRRVDEQKQQLDDLNRDRKITPLHVVDAHDTDVDALRPAAMAEPIIGPRNNTRRRIVALLGGTIAAGALAGTILHYQPNGLVSAQPIPPPPVATRPDLGNGLFSGPIEVDDTVEIKEPFIQASSAPPVPAGKPAAKGREGASKSVPAARGAAEVNTASKSSTWPHVRKIDGKEVWRGGDMKLKAEGYARLAKVYRKVMPLQQSLPLDCITESIFEPPHPKTGNIDTLFPKLKKFGMNEATAAHVIAVLVKHDVDVDDFRPGDKVSFDPNGNIITVIKKYPNEANPRVFMLSNVLDKDTLD